MNFAEPTLAFMAQSGHGKGLPPEMNEYLREQMDAWLAVDKSRKAKHLAALVGCKPPTITNIRKHGRGAGFAVAMGMTKVLGITIEEMTTRAEIAWRQKYSNAPPTTTDDTRPIAANRPGWAEAEAEARSKYSREIAPFAFRLARNIRGLSLPDVLTAEHVREVALVQQRLANDTDRERAVAEETAEVEAADQARWEAHKDAADKAQKAGRKVPAPKLPPGAKVTPKRPRRTNG